MRQKMQQKQKGQTTIQNKCLNLLLGGGCLIMQYKRVETFFARKTLLSFIVAGGLNNNKAFIIANNENKLKDFSGGYFYKAFRKS